MKTSKLNFFTLLCTLFFINRSTFSAVIVSATSGAWNSPSTWVGGVVPNPLFGHYDDVVIATGHTVSLTSNVVYDSDPITYIQGPSVFGFTIQAGGILNLNGYDFNLLNNFGSFFLLLDGIIEGGASGMSNFVSFSKSQTLFSGTGSINNIALYNAKVICGGDIRFGYRKTGANTYGYDGGISNITFNNTNLKLNTSGASFPALNRAKITINNGSLGLGQSASNHGALSGCQSTLVGFFNDSLAELRINNGDIYTDTTFTYLFRVDNGGLIQITNGDILMKIKLQGATSATRSNIRNGVKLVTISPPLTALSSGTITIDGNIYGSGKGRSLIENYRLSTINITGDLLPSGTNNDGELDCQSRFKIPFYSINNYIGNIVNYNGGANQVIKYPNADVRAGNSAYTGYYHLKASNAAIKSLENNTLINGDLTIQNNAQLDATNSNNNIDLKGDWVNTGTNADPFIERNAKVSFTDSLAQNIIANLAGGETFYKLAMNHSGIGVSLVNNKITVTDSLDLTNGVIHTGVYEVDETNNSTGIIVNYSDTSYVDGNLRRNVASTSGNYVFPVGNSNAYELASINLLGSHTVGNLVTSFSNLPSGIGLPLSYLGTTYNTILNCGGTATTVGSSSDGVWTITPNIGTANYNITLNAMHYSNVGSSNSIVKRSNALSPWVIVGTPLPAFGSEPLIANSNGLSGFSQFAIAGGSLATSLHNINQQNSFNYYPNPALNDITITVNDAKNVTTTIELYDVFGNKVSESELVNTNTYLVKRGKLASGVYFLKISINGNQYSQKVVFE